VSDLANSQSDPLKRVRERIEDQAHDHWHEFAVIVASANVLLALVLYGRILETAHADKITYLAIAIAMTSTLAAMFAYYSIQVGILFVAGPLRLTEVLVSFMIAGAQLALFLWPAHILSTQTGAIEVELNGLRHWLLFFAIFCFAGPFANWHAARIRKLRNPTLVVVKYESSQRRDRNAGFTCCVLVTTSWMISFWWPTLAVAGGVAIAITGLAFGIASQERVAKEIANSI
jgi:hypothetical protein